MGNAARLIVVGLIAAAAGGVAAQPVSQWMSDDEIRAAFSGAEISGVYVDGMTFSETYKDSGSLNYSDPRKKMSGRWSVVNRSFCTLYDGFITGGCFRVIRHSANCYEFYFLASSESEAAAPDPGRPRWTARGWNRSAPATCDEKPVV